jgi:hypothetical protein
MKSAIQLLAGWIILFATAGPAHAGLHLDVYEALKKNAPITKDTKIYVAAIGLGILEANVELAISNQPQLYCLPHIVLNADNYIALLDREVEGQIAVRDSYAPDTDIAYILMKALRRSFPCK